MTEKEVVAVARVKAKASTAEQLRQELLSMLAVSRTEPGSIDFLLHRAVEDSSVFVSYERWASHEDLNRHLQTPNLRAFMQRAGELLDAPPEITLLEDLEPGATQTPGKGDNQVSTSDKTIISVLEQIAGSVGAAATDVPMDAYGDKTGREEVVIRYTVGKGEFGTGDNKNVSALHCAMFKLNGERDGTFEGVWQPQIGPQQMLQRPEHPEDPLNQPEGPFPNTYIGAITKAIWTFGDGSAIIGVGPASLQLVPFADGSRIFLVSVAGLISNGTGRYAGARGVKTALGATFIPKGVDMFNLPPGQTFDAVTVETFRIIPRWARKGTLPPAPQY